MLTIIGCGNLNRCDDGVGIVVAQRLANYVQARNRIDVRVFDAGTDGMSVMFRARGADRLVLVDASRSGSEPGAIFQVPGMELALDYQPTYSLHDFRWDHALYAGRKIFGDGFPTDVTVFLIEAASLALGCELSDVVRVAADKVATQIEAIVDQRGAHVRILRGSIYIDRELYEQYMPDVSCVATVARDGRVYILPLRGPSPGGSLLKIRNARGDRVVHADEFLHTVGVSVEAPERRVPVRWIPEMAGLLLETNFTI